MRSRESMGYRAFIQNLPYEIILPVFVRRPVVRWYRNANSAYDQLNSMRDTTMKELDGSEGLRRWLSRDQELGKHLLWFMQMIDDNFTDKFRKREVVSQKTTSMGVTFFDVDTLEVCYLVVDCLNTSKPLFTSHVGEIICDDRRSLPCY
jgi:hypothetical protein